MTILQAIIMGVIEGVTEFLPISSTGHLILAAEFFAIPQTDYVKNFEVVIQLGAILAVLVLYARRLATDWELWKKIIVAFVPTGIIGLLLYDFIKNYLLGNFYVVIWALLIGGFALIIIERRRQARRENGEPVLGSEQISYRQALLIGLAQSVAIIPGVSRAAATIVGGLLLGIRRQTIVEFSFLLAIPTMLAASGFSLYKNYEVFATGSVSLLLVGLAVSFFAALVAVKWLIGYIQNHNFISFGIYRIAVALVFFWLFLV